MARKRNRVRIRRKRLGGKATVVSPRPGAIAGVLGMGMLEVEERQGRIQLVAIGGEPTRHVAQARPMRANEGVALHGLGEAGRISLLERPFPAALGIELDQLAGAFGGIGIILFLPVGHIVVAILQQLRHRAPFRRLVLREHLEPGVRDELKLRNESMIGHVARHKHGVHTLRPIPFKRLDEDRLRTFVTDVYVAHHGNLEARRTAHRSCRRREHPPRTGRRHRHRSNEKMLSGNVHAGL